MAGRRQGGHRLLRRAAGTGLAGAGAVVLCVTAVLSFATGGTAGAASSGSAGAATAAVTGRPLLAYVTDYTAGYLSVISTTAPTKGVVATIPLSLKPAATCTSSATACKATKTHPVGITASPGSTVLYVDCSGTSATAPLVGAIDVVDVATNTVTKVIPLPQRALASAIGPTGTTLYVAATGTFAGKLQGGIDVVDLATGTVAHAVALPGTQLYKPVTDLPSPELIVVGDSGSRVAVIGTTTAGPIGNLDSYAVTTTGGLGTLESNVLGTSGYWPTGIALTPTNSGDAYVVLRHGRTTGKFVSVNVSTAAENGTPKTLPTGFAPTNVAVTAKGTTVAITGTTTTGTTTVSHLVWATPPATGAGTWTFHTSLQLGTTPYGLTFLAGGTYLYEVNLGSNSAWQLDPVTSVVNKITLGTLGGKTASPMAIAFGQAAAAPTTTTTTTTTTTSSTTTTTVPPTTTPTTAPPSTTTGSGTGAQLAYTGDDVTPLLAVGGSLVLAGLALLVADRSWRRTAARALHRRS